LIWRLTWLQSNHLHQKNLTHSGHRDHQLDSCSLVQSAANLEIAPDGLGPHPQIPETVALAELVIEIVETLPIIRDPQLEPVAFVINLDLNGVGSGVADDVIEDLFINEENVAFELERESVIVRIAIDNKGILVCPQQF
jgi:hypothetical protein